jgi:DNA polymerase-3 subunit alpha
VQVNGIGDDFATRLYAVLESCRGGNTAVRIAFSNRSGRGEIELGPDWRVRASPALAQSVSALDGVLEAEFVYGQ